MVSLFFKGFLIGIIVSSPMGPIGMLCIQRTLSKGRWNGFMTGLGAAMSDIIYAAITCLGMGMTLTFIQSHQDPIQFIGSVVLTIFGLYIFSSNPVRSLQKHKDTKTSYTHDFITAFLLTLSNAFIVFLFIALFAHLNFIPADYSPTMIITGLLGIAGGAVFWWYGVTYIVSKLKRWFNIRGLGLLNKIVGFVIIALGIIGTLSVILSHYLNIPLMRISFH